MKMSSGYDVISPHTQRHSCTDSNVIRQTDVISQKRRRHAFGLGFSARTRDGVKFLSTAWPNQCCKSHESVRSHIPLLYNIHKTPVSLCIIL